MVRLDQVVKRHVVQPKNVQMFMK